MPKTRPLIGDPLPINLQGKAKRFCLAMAKGMGYERAGEEAGLTPKSARQYKYRYAEVIQDLVSERLTDLAALAVETLENLLRNGESENVRLGAVKEAFDRVGPAVVKKLIVDIQSSPDEALKAYLLEQLGSEDAVAKVLEGVRPGALTTKPAIEHAA